MYGMQSVIMHVCDGTITIALIIEIGILTSSRYVIVLLICHSAV